MSPLPVFVLPGGFVPPVALFYVVPGEDEARSPLFHWRPPWRTRTLMTEVAQD